jgi:hypothetical protein
MEQIRQITETIGLDEYMNCVLVQQDVRHAMLIQPADYSEAISSDPKTASKLKALKAAFPELIQSTVGGGETLISKKAYTSENVKDNATMGKILGFPCADEYEYTLTHPDEIRVAIEIVVNLKPGGNTETLQIIAYVCRTDAHYAGAKTFAQKAEAVLKADPVIGQIIDSVTATKTTIMPTKHLINELLHNKPLSETDQEEVVNKIWNLGIEGANTYDYDFTNPVHRGALIGLLTFYEYNPIEPFFPLQYHPENARIDEISASWDSELQTIFADPTLFPESNYISYQLLNDIPLDEEDASYLNERIRSLGLESAPTYTYDLKNPVHRGILIVLESIIDNNQLVPFYPLETRPEAAEVDTITSRWDAYLKTIFETKIGGKRKTRRNLRKNRKTKRRIHNKN